MTGRVPRHWFEVEDDDENYWLIDMTFMLSTYTCTFGCGCVGAWEMEKMPGCCATGPFFEEDEDPHRLQQYVDQLKPEHTANYDEIKKRWFIERPKQSQVRKVNGMCIFYNQGTSEDGSIGCALHTEAERQGEDWRDWKPNICWQIPLRVDHEGDYDVLTAWDRDEHGGWGNGENPSGGFWCIDDQANYPPAKYHENGIPMVNPRVYESLENEITRIIGRNAYNALRVECARQRSADLHNPSVPVSIRQKEEANAGDASEQRR